MYVYKSLLLVYRVLKATVVQMALVDMMGIQEKTVPMDQKETMVILAILVHVVYKGNALPDLGIRDLKANQDIKGKRYTTIQMNI